MLNAKKVAMWINMHSVNPGHNPENVAKILRTCYQIAEKVACNIVQRMNLFLYHYTILPQITE